MPAEMGAGLVVIALLLVWVGGMGQLAPAPPPPLPLAEEVESLRSEVRDLRQQLQNLEQRQLMRWLHTEAYRRTLPGTVTCPEGSFPTMTRTNPVYSICVQVLPHIVDMHITSYGHWGICGQLRTLLLATLMQKQPMSVVHVVDVGCNIGACSMAMMATGNSTPLTQVENTPPEWQARLDAAQGLLRSNSAQFLAVDADPLHIEMTRASAALNGAPLAVVQAALSDVEEPVTLHRVHLNSAANFVHHNSMNLDPWTKVAVFRDDQSIPIATSRLLPDVLAAQGVASVHLLKLDTEGSEARILSASEALLCGGHVGVLVFEFSRARIHASGRDPGDLIRLVERCGFQLFEMQSSNEGFAVVERATFASMDADFVGFHNGTYSESDIDQVSFNVKMLLRMFGTK